MMSARSAVVVNVRVKNVPARPIAWDAGIAGRTTNASGARIATMKDIVVTIMTDGDFGTTDATITTDAAIIMIMTTAAVVAEEIKEELETIECKRGAYLNEGTPSLCHPIRTEFCYGYMRSGFTTSYSALPV